MCGKSTLTFFAISCLHHRSKESCSREQAGCLRARPCKHLPREKLAQASSSRSSQPARARRERGGELLAVYDDLIENNRRRMALLEESARLLYREWFVRLRFPGYEHTPIVDGVPQGWERKATLGDSQSGILTPRYDEGRRLGHQSCIQGDFPR